MKLSPWPQGNRRSRIRFANADMWDAGCGCNDLGATVRVTGGRGR